MLKVDYSIKVYVGGDTDISSIFLVDGVCTWDNSTGILAQKWWGSLNSSVDVSLGGNYEAYSQTTVKINGSSSVETTLKNNGLSLINSRLEIIETSSFRTSIIKRGVIRGIPEIGNNVSLQVSHVTNQYNANLTTRLGDEYAYAVYGDNVDDVPVSFKLGTVYENEFINEIYYPSFVVVDASQKDRILARSVYETTQVSEDDIDNYVVGENMALQGVHDLIVVGLDVNGVIIVSGKEYAAVIVKVLPINEKESAGTPYYNAGDFFTLFHVDETILLLPDGATLEDVNFESNGLKSGFPSYLDKVYQEGNKVSVLDADGEGGLFIKNTSATRWATEAEIESLESSDLTYVSDGVGYYADTNTSVSVATGTMINGALIPWRGVGGVASGSVYFEAESTGSVGFFKTSVVSAYDVGVVKKYDSVYVGGNVILDNVVTVVDDIPNDDIYITVVIYVKTILDTYSIPFVSKSVQSQDWSATFPSGEVLAIANLFPFDVENNSQNVNFRWENSSVEGNLGRELDILSGLELIEVELRNPLTVFVECGIVCAVRNFPSALPQSFDVIENSINVFTDVALDYSNLVADGVTGSTGATTVPTAYVDVCSKQNLSSLGIDAPADGWGIEIPSAGASTAVNTADILANAPIVDLIYKSNSTGTKRVKYDLLKYGYGMGYIDSDGLENWANVLDMYSDGGAHIEFYDIIGEPSIKDFDSNRVFSDISVKTSTGTINIRNTEQGIYGSSYVDGVTDPHIRRSLWQSGSILYRKFQVKNEYPTNLSDCTNIVDAITYIKNQYAIAGAISVIDGTDIVTVLYKRYTLGVTVSTKYAIENALWIGSKILFSSPHIASLNTGIITGVSRNLDAGNVTITAEMVGGTIDSIEDYIIVESGSQPNVIIENLGQQPTVYTENL